MRKILVLLPLFAFSCSSMEDESHFGTTHSFEVSSFQQENTFELPFDETSETQEDSGEPKDYHQYVDQEGRCIPKKKDGEMCFYMKDDEIISRNYRLCENTCVDGSACQVIKGEEKVGKCFPWEYVEDKHKKATGDL